MADRLLLTLGGWALALSVLTGGENLALWATLLLVGVLVAREVVAHRAPRRVRARVDLLILGGLVIFAAVVLDRVLGIL